MSNYLTKPYEITLWKDDPSGAEVKICTIGTDTMEGQNRAFEPIFSRNVNGVKKLSFKIYKKYVDTQTGEEIDNPYMSYLISERKVKLHLPEEPVDNQWHDFIIKNVSENSATYLCTYQLEDALVQELSKNGFGVTLDAKLMNNIGTANELAKYVLRETDWGVSDNSEVFVQTIDEALVYLTFPDNTELDTRTTENTEDKVIDNITVYKIIGQQKDDMCNGIIPRELTNEEKNAMAGKTILAFYSSCTGKPHRFQFLYSANETYSVEEELSNYISNDTDYQYYIDFDNPEDDYTVKSSNYVLPIGFATTTYLEYENGPATTLSSKYRGRRYGFSQQAKYIPILDRYVQLYKKGDQEYYGYEQAEYKSPALTQNMISNSTFESTSGWIGTKKDISGEKAKVEAVYGYFNGSTFINAIDELKNGTFDPEKKAYKSYLKLDFNGANSTVINSGPFDNRTLIGKMIPGDKWALKYECANGSNLTFSLGEYKYSSSKDGYTAISYTENPTKERVVFEKKEDEDGYQIFEVVETDYPYSEESFKKDMNVRLQVSASGNGPYYLEKIELFKVTYYNNHIIPLEEQVSENDDGSYKPLEDRIVEKTYYYFTDEALKGITNAEQLRPEATAKTLSYTTYKPVYNEGAQKVRTITAKESNYFNILQSIAETFEAWLTFDISRNDDGGIQERGKKIAFKNYVGGDNYACFRYGVNLKDIQRTFESKNIVTKLIVKNNSNEHADGGFCTIQRASANPTGENYIYDFQYFFNQGLMNSRQYLDTLYTIDGAKGPDYKLWPNTDNTGYLIQRDTKDNIINLKGYFPRIKALNNKIQAESELLANIAQDLTKYKADLAMAEAGLDAATSGIEETREDFLLLTGVTTDMLSGHIIDDVEVGDKQDSEDIAKENGGWYYTDRDWVGTISVFANNKKTITATVNITGNASTSERILYVKVYPLITLIKDKKTATFLQYYNIKCTIEANATFGSGSVDIGVVNSSRKDVQKKLQEYAIYIANENKYISEKTALQTRVDALEAQYNTKQDYIENSLKEWKRKLNQLFFQTYSRFIQEGTWISEEYIDDGLYYADAQSVMYNSCYPQVAYTINVISVEGLPGYEDFKYKLGEKTWVVDPDFFGDEDRESVIITEIVENLDDRSKNQIKVQNFKNQFQDLFQKITATVQQAQYSTGSYEKAVALAEANQERKQQFLTDALDSASARLTTAGQQSVTWGNDGITVKSVSSPNDAIKMVGGAILLSKQDENGEQKWVTGVTSDGVSASLITAGVLNAGEISIMNYDEPVFRWDTFGISAYDATWYNGGTNTGTVINGVNTKKFVRFDKHGIYGISNAGIDGANWHPTGEEYDNDPFKEIDAKATFALTYEGLKVSGTGGTVRIGKQEDCIILGSDNENNPVFKMTDSGNLYIKGEIEANKGYIGGWRIDEDKITSYSDEEDSSAGVELCAKNSGTQFGSPVRIRAGATQQDSRNVYRKVTKKISPPQEQDTLFLETDLNLREDEEVKFGDMELTEYRETYEEKFTYTPQEKIWSNIGTSFNYGTVINNFKSYADNNNLGYFEGSSYTLTGTSTKYCNLTGSKILNIQVGGLILLVAGLNLEVMRCTKRPGNGSKASYEFLRVAEYPERNSITGFSINQLSSSDGQTPAGGYRGHFGPYVGSYIYCIPEDYLTIEGPIQFIRFDDEVFSEKLNINRKYNLIPLQILSSYENKSYPLEITKSKLKVKCQRGTNSYTDLSGFTAEMKIIQEDRKVALNSIEYKQSKEESDAEDEVELQFKITTPYQGCQIILTCDSLTQLSYFFPSNSVYFPFVADEETDSQPKVVFKDGSLNTFEYQFQLKQVNNKDTLSADTNWPVKLELLNSFLRSYEVPQVSPSNSLASFALKYVALISTNTEYPYILTADGTMYASKAHITGDLEATKFVQSVDNRLREQGDTKYIPLFNIRYLGNEFVVYTNFAFSEEDLNNDGILSDFKSLGELKITTLDTWNNFTIIQDNQDET